MEANKLYKLSYYMEGGKWESELSFSHSIDKLQRSVVVNGAWTVVNDPNSPSLKRESKSEGPITYYIREVNFIV